MNISGVRGYVLAGGESSRMQRSDLPPDKALLIFDGETLLERAVRTLHGICAEVSILCGNERRCERLARFGRTVTDRFERYGPVGALDAALQDAQTAGGQWVLLIPVDMPFLPETVLRSLVEQACASRRIVACLESRGMVHPLPAVLRIEAANAIAEPLASGERKLLTVLRHIARKPSAKEDGLLLVGTDPLHPSQMERDRWFLNLNSPGDLRAASAEIS